MNQQRRLDGVDRRRRQRFQLAREFGAERLRVDGIRDDPADEIALEDAVGEWTQVQADDDRGDPATSRVDDGRVVGNRDDLGTRLAYRMRRSIPPWCE
jgi:hypothetical protein